MTCSVTHLFIFYLRCGFNWVFCCATAGSCKSASQSAEMGKIRVGRRDEWGQRFMFAEETWPWELVSTAAVARSLPAVLTCFCSVPQFSPDDMIFWTHHIQNTAAPAREGRKRFSVKKLLARSFVAGRQNRLTTNVLAEALLCFHTCFRNTVMKPFFVFRISWKMNSHISSYIFFNKRLKPNIGKVIM